MAVWIPEREARGDAELEMDVEALRQRQAELVQVLAMAQSPLEPARASGELESLNRQLERLQGSGGQESA